MIKAPSKLPKLVVFDLDYTLWPFWVDTHVSPPFRKVNGNVVDMRNSKIKFYPDTPKVLQTLSDLKIPIGVASRTSEIEGANQLIELFGWEKYFFQKEIYPGCKIAHFEKIKKKTGLEYEEMLFFDDDSRNLKDLARLNIPCVHVIKGLKLREFIQHVYRSAQLENDVVLEKKCFDPRVNV
ncbi:unnamed protein product [Nesidiocoris tenuis]|uniref:Magnesium-dependent phosphatase-1 n=1 Tax=Nesidiocoris tenuis TaxID=355587 RepID=A0A6H5H1T9_9HEMI|nr:unnamed protein product [Nesidiocoris tenuis]